MLDSLKSTQSHQHAPAQLQRCTASVTAVHGREHAFYFPALQSSVSIAAGGRREEVQHFHWSVRCGGM